jgi:HD-GYP domain-containing protein (c-di-GMP phosphodiesterase class II)
MAILLALSKAIEARDPYTRGHSERVTALAEVVADRLGWAEEQRAVLRMGGALHDIGKLAVSEAILRKAGPLTEEELAEVQVHPETGARMIEATEELRPAIPCVLYHHERWDGSGYPSGRAGRLIPVEARILAVADSFDAMTSTRPYRGALPLEQALAEIDRCAGTQFDPDLARMFLEACESRAFAVTTVLRAAAS